MTIVKNDTYSEELMKDFVSSNITGGWGRDNLNVYLRVYGRF